jgi:uncharacterized linocin/CFP29 family protein
MNRDAVGWGQDIWDRIDQAALDEAKRSSVAAAFLPLMGPMPGVLTVPADAIEHNPLSIAEDQFRPIVELSVDFTLTPTQVAGEATLLTAATLTTRATNLLVQAEDALVFQGDAGVDAPVFNLVKRRQSPGRGLLDPGDEEILVSPIEPGGRHYGEHTFSAVAKAYARLQAKGHSGPYALALYDEIYADTLAPLPRSLAAPADRIRPLVTQGFVGTGGLPPSTGVMVSVGGGTIDLVIASDPAVEFSHQDAHGLWHFRVSERFVLRVKEPTAIVRLRFN